MAAVRAQAFVVGTDQERLADGRGGLKLAEDCPDALVKPSWPMPAPTAPELTSATRRPVAATAQICSARWSILAGSSVPSGLVNTLVPTLTTQVRRKARPRRAPGRAPARLNDSHSPFETTGPNSRIKETRPP